MVRTLASSLEVDMKTLLTALASAALLAAPMAASAHGFGGGGGGGHAGFGGFTAHASAPAFRGGGHFGFAGRPYAHNDSGGYRWAVGGLLPALYWDAYVSDPFDYGLEAAPIGHHWVDVSDQALLIQDGTGAVVQVVDL
jgi:Ni/Co efflux regulator RcnB